MHDDPLVIVLISESVNAPSLVRREAAVRLVQAILLGGADMGASVQRLLATLVQSAVDDEIRALVSLHNIPEVPR